MTKPTQEDLEKAWDLGNRAAWQSLLSKSLRMLGINNPETQGKAWILEREAVIALLRSLCAEFGDNQWDVNLHLADVIDKHLMRHLKERLCPQPAVDSDEDSA